MPHKMAFHLGLHCFPKYLFTGIQNEKGKKYCGSLGMHRAHNIGTNEIQISLDKRESRLPLF